MQQNAKGIVKAIRSLSRNNHSNEVEKERKWKNFHDWMLLLVNSVIIALSFLLYKQAVRQNDIAERNLRFADSSLRIAERTIADTRKSIDLSDSVFQFSKKEANESRKDFLSQLNVAERAATAAVLSARALDSSYKIAKSGIELTKSSIDITTSNILLTQRNYEQQNRAYIFLNSVIYDTLRTVIPSSIVINLKNAGKTPAQIISAVSNVRFDTTFYSNVPYLKSMLIDFNLYLAAENTFNVIINLPLLKKDELELIKSNRLMLRVDGEVLFKDVVVNRLFSYVFSFNLLDNGRFKTSKFNNTVREVKDEREWYLVAGRIIDK